MVARLTALECLNTYSLDTAAPSLPEITRVLVDGQWDNPNYWFRYALLRRAIGLQNTEEIGVLGKYSRAKVRKSFSAIGIETLVDYSLAEKPSRQHREQAKKLLRVVTKPSDILDIKLPCGLPGGFLYDEILKRQRRPYVDLKDQSVVNITSKAIACAGAAEEILRNRKFDLVVLSHALGVSYAALACAAIKMGIPVVVLYGDFGVSGFIRIKKKADLFAYPGRPSCSEMNGMQEEAREQLTKQGAKYLQARMVGKTDDVGSVYAYRKRLNPINREGLASSLGWDGSKPMIGVYNSNWFDFPHAHGLKEFRDFHDWIAQTIKVAKANQSVNWLFKAHPCDDWYGSIQGERLEDMVAAIGMPHIRMVDKSINSRDLIRSLDGFITCHGTIGVEAAAMGKPVLTPYPGWYGHGGFVVTAGNRAKYLDALSGEWWKKNRLIGADKKAQLFAGWMFCTPEWQRGFVLMDDSCQDEIYNNMEDFMRQNKPQIEFEVNTIRKWYIDGHLYYHTFKMINSDCFCAPVKG